MWPCTKCVLICCWQVNKNPSTDFISMQLCISHPANNCPTVCYCFTFNLLCTKGQTEKSVRPVWAGHANESSRKQPVTPWVYFFKLKKGNYLCPWIPNMLSVKSVLDIGGHFVVFLFCWWHFLLLLYSFRNSKRFAAWDLVDKRLLLFLMLWSHSKHSQIIVLLTPHDVLSCHHESLYFLWFAHYMTAATGDGS